LIDHYLQLSAAWAPDPINDFFIEAIRAKYEAGGMTYETYVEQRLRWQRSEKRCAWSERPSMQWLSAYAGLDEPYSLSRGLFPEGEPVIDVLMEDSSTLDRIGRSLVIWGRAAEAIPILERAANACTIEYPVHAVRARLHLGMAYQAVGDAKNACDAFRWVE